MTSLVFLPSNTAQRSKKDQEVIQAFARSHAAKVGRPRKTKKPRSYIWTQEISRSTSPEEQDEAPSARSLVQRGNSDPFQSFAVSVTPRVTQLLSFYAEKLLPVRYSTSMIPSVSNDAIVSFRNVEAADDYRSVVAVLHDQSNAIGFLLSQLTIMADLVDSQVLRVENMKIKARALKDFKTQLEKTSRPDIDTIESILLLLNASVYAGDMLEARLHLKFLRRLLEERALKHGPHSLGIVLLFRSLYMDLAVSTTYMTGTLLDVDRWVPEMLTIALSQTVPSPHFRPPPIATFLSNIDSSITNPLLTMFFECRRLLWVWWTQPARAILESGPDVFTVETHPETYTFRWLYSQLYIYSCQIANQVAALQGHNPDLSGTDLTDTSVITPYTQRILAQALLALLSASCTKILVAGQPLKPGTGLLLERLESAIQPALTLLEHEANVYSHGLDRALLWCIFIGAAIERLHGTYSDGAGARAAGAERRVFASYFIRIVHHQELHGKDNVIRLLKRFIYNDHMLPDHQLWSDAISMGSSTA